MGVDILSIQVSITMKCMLKSIGVSQHKLSQHNYKASTDTFTTCELKW